MRAAPPVPKATTLAAAFRVVHHNDVVTVATSTRSCDQGPVKGSLFPSTGRYIGMESLDFAQYATVGG
jgi:hypothetical protein